MDAGAAQSCKTEALRTCYICDAAAAPGKGEHVPPRCLFPRRPEFRKSLIRVPSCKEHNLRKSKDDELLRSYLTSAPGVNRLALDVFNEGVMPSFVRRPYIVETFMRDLRAVRTPHFETGAYSLDLSRFEHSIGCIVRGLFFAEFHERLTAKLEIVWGVLMSPDLSSAPFFDLIRTWENRFQGGYKGANPEVFRYSFSFHDESGGLCRLQFYMGHPIYAVWHWQAESK